MKALGRYGVPDFLLQILGDIYYGRTFCVADANNVSGKRRPAAGISQGCQLSLFLLSMVMTVLMTDAVDQLSPEQHRDGRLLSVLYADDLQSFLDSVAQVAAQYGVELHCKKFQLLQIGGAMQLFAPDGRCIEASETMTYLGTTVSTDGGVGSELNRLLERAWAECSRLSQIWKHSSLSTSRKIELLQCLIFTSKYLFR